MKFFYGFIVMFTVSFSGWTAYWAYVWYADSSPLAAAEVVYAIASVASLLVGLLACRAWWVEYRQQPRKRREHNDVSPNFWRDDSF